MSDDRKILFVMILAAIFVIGFIVCPGRPKIDHVPDRGEVLRTEAVDYDTIQNPDSLIGGIEWLK